MDANDRRFRVSGEASEWWVRLQEPRLSLAVREQYVKWLAESPLHVSEILRIEQIHRALGNFKGWHRIATDTTGGEGNVVQFPALSSGFDANAKNTVSSAPVVSVPSVSVATSSPWRAAARTKVHRTVTRRVVWSAIAAGTAAAAIFVAWTSLNTQTQIIQTALGERRDVALSDGSHVVVDPDSRLTVEFSKLKRRVDMERGRAMFRVSKGPNRPFFVVANGEVVRAVGTAFGVEQRSQSLVVTVEEGRVKLSNDRSESSAATLAARIGLPWPAPSARSDVFLGAGEQAVVQSTGSAAPLVRNVNTHRELAWAEGLLVCDNDSVADVVERFNRYNLTKLRVTDSSIAGRSVSGVFDATDPEAFVAFVQKAATVSVVRDGGREIVIAPPAVTGGSATR